MEKYAHRISKAEFLKCVEDRGFIDYDGYGEYLDSDGKHTDEYIVPSEAEAGLWDDKYTELDWYNR